jgi:hypothetical protein
MVGQAASRFCPKRTLRQSTEMARNLPGPTTCGREGYDKYRHDFSKLIWRLASPQWKFDDATFDRSAKSFESTDHVAIVIHNYRWRIALAEGEARLRRSRQDHRGNPCHISAGHHDGRRR